MTALTLAAALVACVDDPTQPTPVVPTRPALNTGSGPVLSVSPTSLKFPDEFVTQNTAALTVTVTNTGTDTLTYSAALGGTNPRDFMEYGSPTCGWFGFALAPAESCVFSLSFIPSDTGQRSATLDITSNGGSASVVLSGYGSPPAPVLSVSPTSLFYADQLVGTTSATQQLTIRNLGTGEMHITSWKLGGDNPGDFKVSVPSDKWACALNATMYIYNECHLLVAFTPTAAGARSAVVLLQTAEGPSATITLDGNGTALADMVVNFAGMPSQVQAGKTLSYAITFVNAGPGSASGVVMTDVIPAGTTFVSLLAASDVFCSAPAVGGTGTVTCSMRNALEINSSRSVQIVVKALSGGRSTITNTAVVSSLTPDPVTGNNTATVTTTVIGKK